MTNRTTTQERVERINLHLDKVLNRYTSLLNIIHNTDSPSAYTRAVNERRTLNIQLKQIRDKLNRKIGGVK